MLKIDHLTKDQLADTFKSGRLDSAQAYHVEHCGVCRTSLADAVLAARIGRAPSEPALGQHLDARSLEEFHLTAYEHYGLGVSGLRDFLDTLRHLNRCDACFARFFDLHQALTPSQSAVDGAVASFEAGQPYKRVGTLVITRALERLSQFFQPKPGAAEQAGAADARSQLSMLRRSLVESLDLPPPSEAPRSASASPPDGVWFSLMTSESGLPPPSPASMSASMGRSLGPDEDLDHLRGVVEQRARQLAEILQQEAAELARFRRSFVLAAKQKDSTEAMKAHVQGFKHLQGVMESHAVHADDLLRTMAMLGVELERREALEELRLTRLFIAEPERIALPGVTLELTTSWQGAVGRIEVTARDSSSSAPLPGVRLDVRSEVPRSSDQVVETDSDGRAALRLDADTTGLLVWLDDPAKPWLIRIEQREDPSTR
jgi:hypothetical protein